MQLSHKFTHVKAGLHTLPSTPRPHSPTSRVWGMFFGSGMQMVPRKQLQPPRSHLDHSCPLKMHPIQSNIQIINKNTKIRFLQGKLTLQVRINSTELMRLSVAWPCLLLSLFNLWNTLKLKKYLPLAVGWTRLKFFFLLLSFDCYNMCIHHVIFIYICKTGFIQPWATPATHFCGLLRSLTLECNGKLGQRFAPTECRRAVNPELTCQEHVQHIQRESQKVPWLDNTITFQLDLFSSRPQEELSFGSVTQKRQKQNCWCC